MGATGVLNTDVWELPYHLMALHSSQTDSHIMYTVMDIV